MVAVRWARGTFLIFMNYCFRYGPFMITVVYSAVITYWIHFIHVLHDSGPTCYVSNGSRLSSQAMEWNSRQDAMGPQAQPFVFPEVGTPGLHHCPRSSLSLSQCPIDWDGPRKVKPLPPVQKSRLRGERAPGPTLDLRAFKGGEH